MVLLRIVQYAGMKQRSNDPQSDEVTLLNPIDLPDPHRREFLMAAGGTGMLLVAGCLGDDDDAETYLVSFTDQDIEVEARSDRTVWDEADDAGVDIPYQCGVGRCGQCTIRYEGDATDVVEHTDDQRYLDDDQVADGWILTCVAYARDDFDAVVAHPDD